MCDSQSIPGAVADGSIRWPRARPRQRNRRHQSELPVQIVQDANWHILVSIEKAPVLTEHAQLERKTPAVVVAAAALHFRVVGLG